MAARRLERRVALKRMRPKRAAAPTRVRAAKATTNGEIALERLVDDARRRVVIENVRPQVENGRFPAKASLGETVRVEADVFADGHDELSGEVRFRGPEPGEWTATPLTLVNNDHWWAEFPVARVGLHAFTLSAWVDPFKSWRRDLAKRVEAGQDVSVDLLVGADLVAAAAARAAGPDAGRLAEYARGLRSRRGLGLALDQDLAGLMAANPDRTHETSLGRELKVFVEPERARYSTWYELFPRSAAREPGRHGTFRDVEALLPEIDAMGFDVLYLPPIHPIGGSHRKGRNNAEEALPSDPGSPWAIGAAEGGHKSIHPQLGSLAEFRHLVAAAREIGIEVALDIAFQSSPDHPYVREHPEWFRKRPDGGIQYAENPPKKYQDIYPFDFDTGAWRTLWEELLSVFLHWVDQGVRVFRVDNPHTKPFPFWEWVISEIKRRHPEVILLSEAFTRPRIMYRLAKVGFSQSYTYFAWRTTATELREYFTELTRTEVRDYFRPNLWPNTPDILTEELQTGGRPAFMSRLVLAATLGASYGIYGPPYELMEHVPLAPGKEEYLGSEKYEIRHWDPGGGDGLREFITRVNRIRAGNPALQTDRGLEFTRSDNEHLLPYVKIDPASDNAVFVVVNLDHFHTQAGWVEVPLERLGIGADSSYQVHDMLSDATYTWRGAWNYVELNPHATPAHVLRVQRPASTPA